MRKKNFNRLLTLGGILFLLLLFLFSYEKISKLIEETKNISPFKTLKQQDIKKIIFEKENKNMKFIKKIIYGT
jgi:hypothetical protein